LRYDNKNEYNNSKNEKEYVIKVNRVDIPISKNKKITLRGRVKKVPNTINYNELLFEYENNAKNEKSISSEKNNQTNKIDDFIEQVKNKEFYDKNKENEISPNEGQLKKNINPLPRTNQDLIFF